MATTPEPIIIAKQSADLLLIVNDPEPQMPDIVNLIFGAPNSPPTSQSFLVSSTIMSHSSSVFNAMLNNGFSESLLPSSPAEHRKITLPDNTSAFHKILLALHHCNLSVPRNLEIGEIYNIASLVDKYDLYEALFPWIDLWCRKNDHRVGVDGKNEDLYCDGSSYERVKRSDSRWLFIGWVCRRGMIFREETAYYLPRLRVLDKNEAPRDLIDSEPEAPSDLIDSEPEAPRDLIDSEPEDVYTVYRRGVPVDRGRWAVDPIEGLGDKILGELWEARCAILEPVVSRWREYYKSLKGANQSKTTVCLYRDLNCDNEGLALLQRLMMHFGIKSIDVEGEAENDLRKFSLAEIRRHMDQTMKDCPQTGRHSGCGVRDAVISWERFKGLKPWGRTKKDKY